MNTRFILYTATGAMLWPCVSWAGSGAGGSGAGAVRIPADTISTGGGSSTGGSGANAVIVTASMGGVISTVAAASPAITNKQGFIPQITGLTGFDLWASLNIPAGRDAAFAGDWNGDGILNGLAYVFGNSPISMTGKGKIPVPHSIPGDVDVYLDYTLSLTMWDRGIVRWVNGAPPEFIDGDVSIVGNEVVDTLVPGGGKAFYRYRVVKR